MIRSICRPAQAVSTALAILVSAATFPPEDASAQAGAADSAVVLVYQRFGENNKSENSVKLAEFDAHLKELTSGKYRVMALPDILAAIRKGEKLDNRTVAITIDDSFRSVYDNAWPRLKKAGLPFTLFVSTDPADLGRKGYMSWSEIRELRDAGVTIGSLTAGFTPVSEVTIEEFRADMQRAMASFDRELGARPTLFSWPRGEMSGEAARMLSGLGFEAAFGYHSGPIHPMAEMMMMPRFAMVGDYAKQKNFMMRIDTLALPMTSVEPAEAMIEGQAPDKLSFTIDPAAGRIRNFHCFHSETGELAIREVGDRRYEAALEPGKSKGIWRINCTMPTGGKRYRWWGMQYFTR